MYAAKHIVWHNTGEKCQSHDVLFLLQFRLLYNIYPDDEKNPMKIKSSRPHLCKKKSLKLFTKIENVLCSESATGIFEYLYQIKYSLISVLSGVHLDLYILLYSNHSPIEYCIKRYMWLWTGVGCSPRPFLLFNIAIKLYNYGKHVASWFKGMQFIFIKSGSLDLLRTTWAVNCIIN